MSDLRLLREDPDRARDSQRARGDAAELVDAVLAADQRHRGGLAAYEQLRAEQKATGRRIARASGADRTALLARAGELSGAVKAAAATSEAAQVELDALLLELPNVVADGVPAGGEDDYVVLREVGDRPEMIVPRDHLELGELLGAIDMTRGAKVSGARFSFLVGVGARLQHALLSLALERALHHGLVPVVPPTLVRPEVMAGTGFLGAHAAEVYRLAEDDLWLVGTSEVPLAGMHADEVLDLSDGPLRYAGWSTCYRREAGSYGKDTRGIIRVHQFDKVEMFSFVRAEEAVDEHARMLAMEEEMLGLVEVPYRVIDVAAGDLGTSAARKYDCEGWLPSQGRYRELTSTSNCTTFQARRLGIRERRAGEDTTRHVATLNGTLATTRWIAAILENHQQPDGAIRLPKALRSWFGGHELLEPVLR